MAELFRFKQFSLRHGKSSMKVGTDGLLLGAWSEISNDEYILDVGSGCGLIALMIAQRNKSALIKGIDIHEPSVVEANENAKSSPWSKRVSFQHMPLQSFNPEVKFNHIVSNPPFFTKGTKSPQPSRQAARHTNDLSFDDLAVESNRLLIPEGKLSVIIPEDAFKSFHQAMTEQGYYCIRNTQFYPKQNHKIERYLLCYSKIKIPCETNTFVHYNDDNTWTNDYIQLTKDFHSIIKT